MPVVTVFAPPPESGDTHAVLASLNAGIATALDLPVDGVHSMLVPVSAACTGAAPTSPWPTAVLHGGRRTETAMTAALTAATDCLAQAWDRPADQVWVQWHLTEPG